MPSGRNTTARASLPPGSLKVQHEKFGSVAGKVPAGLSLGAALDPTAANVLPHESELVASNGTEALYSPASGIPSASASAISSAATGVPAASTSAASAGSSWKIDDVIRARADRFGAREQQQVRHRAHRGLGALVSDAAPDHGERERGHDADDRDDGHHLDQREAAAACLCEPSDLPRSARSPGLGASLVPCALFRPSPRVA